MLTNHYVALMTPTGHDKAEWARMAQSAYAAGRSDVGHRFSARAAMAEGDQLYVGEFDAYQSEYRAWLVFGTFR